MTRKRQNDRQQLRIDDAIAEHDRDVELDWRERTSALRARLHSIDQGSTGLTLRRWEIVRELLMAIGIAALRSVDGRCRETARELLARAQRGTALLRTVDQLYAARRDAERLGLVCVMRSSRDDSGARGPDALWLDAARIRSLIEARGRPPSNSFKQHQPGSTSFKQVQTGGAQRARAPKNPPKGDSEREHLDQSSSSLPLRPYQSTTNTSARSARLALVPHWTKAEGEVLNFGVSKAAEAVAAVKDHGGSPAVIRELLAYAAARASAWRSPAGALYWRLMRWRPGQRVDVLWPPAATGWVSVEVQAARQAARRREQAARDQAAAAAAQFAASLESLVGPAVDALSDEQIAELLADTGPLLAAWRASGKKRTGLYREALIERVAARRRLSAQP